VIVPVPFGARPLEEALDDEADGFAAAAESWTPSDDPHVWVFDLRAGALRRSESRSARLVLRSLIGAYAPELSGRLAFGRRPGGKPLARTPDGSRRFRSFNASHSHGVLAVAIAPSHARAAEVGVDVEVADGAPPSDRAALRAWVTTEARLKCVGVGLGAHDTPDVRRAVAMTSVANLGSRWRTRVAGDGSGWPELELALAWA
jgi:hypothetical protein